ncbi:MAG: heavy metal-binding domain-containing protein [Deltaproteobacteria bacterium]|nr:heavy metal-binding domain-containing protein [Deltaproteobacteria bacterium]
MVAVANQHPAHQVLIITTFTPPPGQEVEAIVGPCWGITVRSRSLGGQLKAGCQTLGGGEITALTELAVDSRNQAMKRLEQHAISLGANAVFGFQFDSGELMQNTNEIVAYGTAVKLRPIR